ncbi:MAG: SMC family ATPase [Myxococcota bacterium]
MRFTSLRMKGIGPFTDEVFIDLDQVPGPLVAITGSNGAGKSMSLEAMFGGVYRKMPTRGSLRDVATARDSFVEVGVVNGQPWTMRQRVDAHSGKGEAVILDASGAAVLDAAKVREADAWVAEHLPSPAVVLSSMFGAQGSQGFLDLDPAERKRVVLSILGHDRLDALSKAAGERARTAKAELDTLVARIADERDRAPAGDPETLRGELMTLRRALDLAQTRADAAAASLRKAHADAVEHERQAAAQRQARAELAALSARRVELQIRLGDIDVRRRNNQDLVDRGDAIRAAAKRHDDLTKEVERLRDQKHQVERVVAKAEAVQTVARRDAQHAREALARAEADVANAEQAEAERTRLQTRLVALQAAADEADAAERSLADARQRLAELEQLRLDGKDRRIRSLREGLEDISESRFPHDVASRVLVEDDALAVRLGDAPQLIAEARVTLDECEARARDVADAKAECDRVARDIVALTAAADQDAAASALGRAQKGVEQADADVASTEGSKREALATLDGLSAKLNGVERSLTEHGSTAKDLARLEASEARIAELGEERDRIVAEQTKIADAIAAAEQSLPTITVTAPDTKACEDEAEAAQSAVAERRAEVVTAERELERAETSTKRRIELTKQRAAVETELADFRLLEQDLGRNGVQALELDAVGPELTELANDLLRTCLGPRFSVRIDATKRSADGKKKLEGCWVTVCDTESNREAEARTFSGGERVLLGEAVNLALTMMGVRHAGFSRPTIVRDETGAALDGERGRAYVAMLRRAAELVDADRVLFVTHQAELHELADARIHAEDGTLTVVS